MKKNGIFVKLRNGWYELLKYTTDSTNSVTFSIVGLIPIKSQYDIRNEYLKNNFHEMYDVPEWVDLTLPAASSTYIVKNKNGKDLFSIHAKEIHQSKKPHWAIIILYICGLLVLCIFIHQISVILVSLPL